MSSQGAAPAIRRIGALVQYEVSLLLRNGEQLLLTVIIPIALLFGLHAFASALQLSNAEILASVISIAVIATSFTSLAIGTAFERRSASLELLATTPLNTLDLLLGKALAIAAFELGQLVLILVIAALLGLNTVAVIPVIFAVILGSGCFAAAGFFIAGVFRAEAVLAVANALFLFFLLACGITIPLHTFGPVWRSIVAITPATALYELLLAASSWSIAVGSLAVLLVWGVIAAIAARFTFSWS